MSSESTTSSVAPVEPPALRRLRADLDDVPFQIGADEGRWGVVVDPAAAWPNVVFWVAAAERPASPERFHLRLNFDGYPALGPSGSFWNVDAADWLAASAWPKGRGQVAAVFRIDWAHPRHVLYHPLDRVSLSTHPNWPREYPADVWRSDKDASHYLHMVHGLLNCNDYTGI